MKRVTPAHLFIEVDNVSIPVGSAFDWNRNIVYFNKCICGLEPMFKCYSFHHYSTNCHELKSALSQNPRWFCPTDIPKPEETQFTMI